MRSCDLCIHPFACMTGNGAHVKNNIWTSWIWLVMALFVGLGGCPAEDMPEPTSVNDAEVTDTSSGHDDVGPPIGHATLGEDGTWSTEIRDTNGDGHHDCPDACVNDLLGEGLDWICVEEDGHWGLGFLWVEWEDPMPELRFHAGATGGLIASDWQFHEEARVMGGEFAEWMWYTTPITESVVTMIGQEGGIADLNTLCEDPELTSKLCHHNQLVPELPEWVLCISFDGWEVLPGDQGVCDSQLMDYLYNQRFK